MKNIRLGFSERLAEICADRKLFQHGRQAALMRVFKGQGMKVSQPAIKKWFDRESLPETEKIIFLAIWADVTVEWLMTGRGPKRLGEVYATPSIAGMVEVMQTLETSEQAKLLRMAIALKEPTASPTETDPLSSASSGQ
jgi:hypothetical protein